MTDWKLVLIAGVPPILAIILEFFNPISASVSPEDARRLTTPWTATAAHASGAAEVVTSTAEGVLEAGGILPTWISCTAAVVSVAADKASTSSVAVYTLLWVIVSAFIGYFFVSRLKAYILATRLCPCPVRIFARTWTKAISWAMVIANLGVLVFIFCMANLSEQQITHSPAPQVRLSLP